MFVKGQCIYIHFTIIYCICNGLGWVGLAWLGLGLVEKIGDVAILVPRHRLNQRKRMRERGEERLSLNHFPSRENRVHQRVKY